MPCCGGRARQVRKQVVPQAAETPVVKQTIVQRTNRASAQAAPPVRQYVIPRSKCVKCGYPTMAVYIAGRERQQCTNANCRTVVS